MDTKFTALSDDELMEVTGGLVQLINPTTCSVLYTTKEKCKIKGDCNCSWNESEKKCEGGCL